MPRRPNTFSGPYLDRIAHLRKDAAWVDEAWQSERARIVPLHDSRNLLQRDDSGVHPIYLDRAAAAALEFAEPVLLGEYHGAVYFATELADPQGVGRIAHCASARFEDLRMLGGLLPEHDAGVLAYARAMLYWRHRHRFCGVCGSPNAPESAGHLMRCTNPACRADHFPRLDPAIIVLVSDGERALLGRQASWPPGRYSTIAGFVEPGESLEDAVVREVLEETGVAVDDVEYHSSQPWPFPSSLMIGFFARAAAESVPRADEELEDVRWFTREDLASGAAGLPPSQSVSFRLIEDWFDAGADVPLRSQPGLKLWSSGRR